MDFSFKNTIGNKAFQHLNQMKYLIEIFYGFFYDFLKKQANCFSPDNYKFQSYKICYMYVPIYNVSKLHENSQKL